MTTESSDDEGRMELVFDVHQDNAANVEFAPEGVGATVTLMDGVDAPKRMVIRGSVSIADIERLLMSALSAIELNWADGAFEEAGEDPKTRDPRMLDRTWAPWSP